MSARAHTRERLWRSILTRSADAGADFELLDRWRAGDRAAGAELCRRHHGALRGFFATKCRGEAAALATETLLSSARAGAPPDERAGFRAYLFALARRELHRHLQQRRDRRIDFSTASVAELLAPNDDAPAAPAAPAAPPAISGPGSRAGSSS
jgi:DNA-directed RNA polymerase specialized sigma24 family protein